MLLPTLIAAVLLAAEEVEPVAPWIPALLAIGGVVLAAWWLLRGHGAGWDRGAERLARERAQRDLDAAEDAGDASADVSDGSSPAADDAGTAPRDDA